MRRSWRCPAVLLGFVFAAATTGCMSTLAPPRTVPPGTSRVYMLIEGSRQNDQTYLAPRLMVRHGMTERVDAGLELGVLAGGADVKWNAVRGPVDVAWDLGASGWVGPSLRDEPAPLSGSSSSHSLLDGKATVIIGAPVLLGFNVARRVSLIALGGDSLVLRDGELPHALYRAGAGVDLRARSRFAVQFELEALYDVPRGAGAQRPEPILMGGVGFAFGHESEYDDVDGGGRARR